MILIIRYVSIYAAAQNLSLKYQQIRKCNFYLRWKLCWGSLHKSFFSLWCCPVKKERKVWMLHNRNHSHLHYSQHHVLVSLLFFARVLGNVSNEVWTEWSAWRNVLLGRLHNAGNHSKHSSNWPAWRTISIQTGQLGSLHNHLCLPFISTKMCGFDKTDTPYEI